MTAFPLIAQLSRTYQTSKSRAAQRRGLQRRPNARRTPAIVSPKNQPQTLALACGYPVKKHVTREDYDHAGQDASLGDAGTLTPAWITACAFSPSSKT